MDIQLSRFALLSSQTGRGDEGGSRHPQDEGGGTRKRQEEGESGGLSWARLISSRSWAGRGSQDEREFTGQVPAGRGPSKQDGARAEAGAPQEPAWRAGAGLEATCEESEWGRPRVVWWQAAGARPGLSGVKEAQKVLCQSGFAF